MKASLPEPRLAQTRFVGRPAPALALSLGLHRSGEQALHHG